MGLKVQLACLVVFLSGQVRSGRVGLSGGIAEPGKFDALDGGHRELAIQASKVEDPYLLSFEGMAEVLG
ncbi:PROTEIN-S ISOPRENYLCYSTEINE O-METHYLTRANSFERASE [Salix purpurea]|uniref:PROTEIN-S ISOPRENYLCYSTEINE O-METHYLTRANSFERASE n=1 Tax=Salix purpurea TaxID=77065 RepID=A0A9Q1AKR5_SALPP|nr:PROTEIN-S ISOPRENYLCYSTEINE O-METHYLTRANSFERASE [Salix purpurea]